MSDDASTPPPGTTQDPDDADAPKPFDIPDEPKEGVRFNFAKLAHEEQRSARTMLFGLAAIAAAWLVGAIITESLDDQVPALTYRVVGHVLDDRGTLRASQETGGEAAFSDGSKVTVSGDTEVRVTEMGADGATLELLAGVMRVRVADNAGAKPWHIKAGSLALTAPAGARLRSDWSPESETLSLEVFEGSVEVVAPKLQRVVRVGARQRLVIVASATEARLDNLGEVQVWPDDKPLPEPWSAPARAPAASDVAKPTIGD